MCVRREAAGRVPAKRKGFGHTDGGKGEEYAVGEEGWLSERVGAVVDVAGWHYVSLARAGSAALVGEVLPQGPDSRRPGPTFAAPCELRAVLARER